LKPTYLLKRVRSLTNPNLAATWLRQERRLRKQKATTDSFDDPSEQLLVQHCVCHHFRWALSMR